MTSQRGFSLAESLVALLVLISVMAIAFGVFVAFGRTFGTESATLDAQQTARGVVDDVVRATRQAGFGVTRRAPYNNK